MTKPKKGLTTLAATGKHAAKIPRGVRVRALTCERVLDVSVIAGSDDPACPVDGLLGMDVLGTCVLILGPVDVLAHCGAEPRGRPGRGQQP